MANNVQILEKPYLLMPGDTGFFKVNNRLWIIEIVSDNGTNVVFTYPLKADGVQHTVSKDCVFVELGALSNYN